jgi:hypothetical protein
MNPFALFKTLDNIDLKELREQLRILNDWIINLLELTQKEMHNNSARIKELEEQRAILKTKLADKCWEKCHVAAKNDHLEDKSSFNSNNPI